MRIERGQESGDKEKKRGRPKRLTIRQKDNTKDENENTNVQLQSVKHIVARLRASLT